MWWKMLIMKHSHLFCGTFFVLLCICIYSAELSSSVNLFCRALFVRLSTLQSVQCLYELPVLHLFFTFLSNLQNFFMSDTASISALWQITRIPAKLPFSPETVVLIDAQAFFGKFQAAITLRWYRHQGETRARLREPPTEATVLLNGVPVSILMTTTPRPLQRRGRRCATMNQSEMPKEQRETLCREG